MDKYEADVRSKIRTMLVIPVAFLVLEILLSIHGVVKGEYSTAEFFEELLLGKHIATALIIMEVIYGWAYWVALIVNAGIKELVRDYSFTNSTRALIMVYFVILLVLGRNYATWVYVAAIVWMLWKALPQLRKVRVKFRIDNS